jgi:hypothetical protein
MGLLPDHFTPTKEIPKAVVWDPKAGMDSEKERKIHMSLPGIQPQSSTSIAVTLHTELDNTKVYQKQYIVWTGYSCLEIWSCCDYGNTAVSFIKAGTFAVVSVQM